MKFFIVLALLGAVFADVEVDPVMVADLPLPDLSMIDFGVAYIPDAVIRELGLDKQPEDVIDTVQFVDVAAEEDAGIAPEVEPVQFVDIAPEALVGDAPVDAVIADEGALEGSVHFVESSDDSPVVDNVQVVDIPMEEVAPQEYNPTYRGKYFANPLARK